MTHAVIVIECDIEKDAPVNVLAQIVDPLRARFREEIDGVQFRTLHIGIDQVADGVVKHFTAPH